MVTGLDFKRPRLSQVPRRFLNRARLRLLARRSVGARDARAGIDIRNRAVVDDAELVGLDRHRPARQLLLATRIVLGLHYGFSTGAPTRLPHSVHEPS